VWIVEPSGRCAQGLHRVLDPPGTALHFGEELGRHQRGPLPGSKPADRLVVVAAGHLRHGGQVIRVLGSVGLQLLKPRQRPLAELGQPLSDR
jgi:hypothetical protein